MYNGTAIVGAQWGDEGKGKIIDIFAGKADVVVRSQGGNNAGHTVVADGETYKLHLIPSGILYKGTMCLVGAGTVIDPKAMCEEIEGLTARGISFDKFRIDPRAHIITPYHIALDRLSELSKGDNKIGTTGRGIGPSYVDKYDRTGIRFHDLVNFGKFAEKIRSNSVIKNKIITSVYGGEAVDPEKVIEEYKVYSEKLSQYIADVSVITYEALRSGKNVLFEGAQAALLDIDFGTYPFVTSSHPTAAGSASGAGVGPNAISEIIGVAKAYTTRVGEGPFPTELSDKTGDLIRKNGGEYGTTTGRPRRTGHFDAVIIRHSVRVNGLTKLAINKLDVLSGTGELKIASAYKLSNGSVIREYPGSIEILADCEPVYEVFPGFETDISKAGSFDELPETCRNFINRIEELSGCPVSFIGNGPSRDKLIVRNP